MIIWPSRRSVLGRERLQKKRGSSERRRVRGSPDFPMGWAWVGAGGGCTLAAAADQPHHAQRQRPRAHTPRVRGKLTRSAASACASAGQRARLWFAARPTPLGSARPTPTEPKPRSASRFEVAMEVLVGVSPLPCLVASTCSSPFVFLM
jgi:hypothetical protein